MSCSHRSKGRTWRKCGCPINVEGYLGDAYIRQSIDTRSWEVAQFKVREMEATARLPKPKEQPEVTIAHAVDRFMQDAQARNLTGATMAKLRVLLEKQLIAFCQASGFQHIRQLQSVDVVSSFREGWKDAPISALKKLELLRSFFRFCRDRAWIDTNPARAVASPKVTPKSTLPFTTEDMEKILWACDLFSAKGRYRSKNRTRIKAMVLLLRYSGLRIQDAVTLRRDRITDGRLFLYTQKTGVPVDMPLPEIVTSALAELDHFQDRFSGMGRGRWGVRLESGSRRLRGYSKLREFRMGMPTGSATRSPSSCC